MDRLKHLSPSSLNLFRAQPALWVGKYLMGWKDAAGPAAWRGQAVEAGLDSVLYGREDSAQRAMGRFELDASGESTEAIDKQRALIAPMLAQATEACKTAGIPTGRQFKIEHHMDGVPWPIIGFIDYLYPDFSFDLKTTERAPSSARSDHILGQSVYAAATKRPAKLLYVTPKKAVWFEVDPEQQRVGLEEVGRLGRAVAALLALSDDPVELLRALPCDFSDFHWNDELKAEAIKIIGE